ncbi:hypothetical protein V757_11245 [Pelistega indica]|uniref:Transglycosylase SLT domain-containing protein n=1 Tax=Pelistega indica TaxID=1414851 RepID=V8FVW8_9BURK|nr:lytic transglycosylase domain-containing protein [Pelistega indica]ETD67557.1 hypothetical protein V757_11245 [Pelistega indica]
MANTFMDVFNKAAAEEGISGTALSPFALSIFGQESGFGRNTKTSNHGTTGIGQMLPATFNSVADKGWDINNAEHNMRASMRYIKQLYNTAGGDLHLTAVGYYGGPGAIKAAQQGVYYKDRKNPNAPDTNQYATQVINRMNGILGQTGQAGYTSPQVANASSQQASLTFGQLQQDRRQSAPSLDAATDVMPAYSEDYYPDTSGLFKNTLASIQPGSVPQDAFAGLSRAVAQNPELANVFTGKVPAAQITLGGRSVIAMPTTEEERNFFTSVQQKPYDEQTKDSIIKAYSQLSPAREQALGKSMFNTQPTDLDGYLRDIVENV